MTNEETSHIFYVEEQVKRFAANKEHTHKLVDITDMSDKYSEKPHASNSPTDHGAGTTSAYGHVRVNTAVNEGDGDSTKNTDGTTITNDMPVSNSGIATYVKKKIQKLNDDLRRDLQAKFNILKSRKTTGSPGITKDSSDSQIPTAKAVWEALVDYKDLLIGVDLGRPEITTLSLNELITPGYYKQTKLRHFSYGGETIYYANALIKVEKQANRVIQHVYATSKVTSAGQTTYKINGSEYTRWGTGATDGWKAWHVAHKPYTKTARVGKLGANVDKNSVVVYENTAGFIIHWDQNNSAQDRYTIYKDLYEYATVCTFNPPLPIKGPYVFGNLIGRMDIRITSTKMEIRSNVQKGGRIIGMHETYFVPRNQ